MHGLSQQDVWVPFWTPKPLKRAPQDTHFFSVEFLKIPNLKLIIEFFHLLIIPMKLFMISCLTLMNLYMFMVVIPLKIWTPKNFTTANFRHPVSKSWLRHCLRAIIGSCQILGNLIFQGRPQYTQITTINM